MPRTGDWILRLSFAAIVGTFVLASGLAIHRAGAAQAENRRTVERMLTSVELVSKLATDVDQKRLLVDSHIFQREQVDMDRVEERIARVDAEFAATARDYAPFASQNGEKVVWEDLRAEAGAVGDPIRRALALSRQNHDEEARAILTNLDGDFEAIARDASTLVRINRAEADYALSSIRERQRSSLLFTVGITAAGIVLSVVVATVVSRIIRRREEELRASSEQLVRRNRELDAFAGRVAHDLRGPLTTINLAASRLSERAPREEGTTAVLRRGVNRMEVLIRDLLTLSRVDAETKGAASDPAAVAAAVAEELGPRVLAEGGVLRVAVQPARVRCSEGLLRQVLWNLVDNALKYRRIDARPEIDVVGSATAPAAGYELRVSDRGMGMSHEDARQVFEPFFRAVQSRDMPGTGLGLSIVKRVVEVHGGAVAVESQLGEGTTFTIDLPLETRAGRAAPRETETGARRRVRFASPLTSRLRAWRASLRGV